MSQTGNALHESIMAQLNGGNSSAKQNASTPAATPAARSSGGNSLHESIMAQLGAPVSTQQTAPYTAGDWANAYNGLIDSYNQTVSDQYTPGRFKGYENQLSDLINKYDEVKDEIGEEYLDTVKKMRDIVNQERWAEDYEEIVNGIASYNESLGEGYSTDHFGGYKERLQGLIDGYDTVSSFIGSEYKDQLLDLQKTVQEMDEQAAQYTDEVDWNIRGRGFGSPSDKVDTENAKLRQETFAQAQERAIQYDATRKTAQNLQDRISDILKSGELGYQATLQLTQYQTQLEQTEAQLRDMEAKGYADAQAYVNQYNRNQGILDSYSDYAGQNAPRGTGDDELGIFLNMSTEDRAAALMAEEMYRAGIPADLTGSTILQKAKAGNWDKLNEDEINIYYNVRDQLGDEAAQEFLTKMEPILGKRTTKEATITADTLDEIGKIEEGDSFGTMLGKIAAKVGAGAVLNAVSVSTKLAGAMPAFVSDFINTVSGKDINPYDEAHMMQNMASGIRGAYAERINKLTGASEDDFLTWGDVYQSVMSSADSALGGALGGTGYGILMGMDAASSTARELYENGADRGQIVAGALLGGAAEMIFEKVSLDHFADKILKNGAKSKIELVRNILIQGGVEASEEIATEIANTISEALVQKNNSQWEKDIREYQKLHPDESRAKAIAHALVNVAVSAGQAGVGGFISGAGMGAFGSKVGFDNNVGAGQDLINTGSVQEMLDTALEIDPKNSEAKRLAAKLKAGTLTNAEQGRLQKIFNSIFNEEAARKKTGEASKRDLAGLGQLWEQNKEAIAEQDKAKIRSAVENRLHQLSESGNVKLQEKGDISAVAEAITKKAAGEELSLKDRLILRQSTNAQRVMNEMDPANIASGDYNSQWAEEIGTDNLNVAAYNLGLDEDGKPLSNRMEPVRNESEEMSNGTEAEQQPGAETAGQPTAQPGAEQPGQIAAEPAAQPGRIAEQDGQQPGQIPDGSQERDAGGRTFEQSGSIREGTEEGQQAPRRTKTFNQRFNITRDLRGQLQKVSPRSLGIENGIESNSVYVIDEAHMDDGLRQLKDRIYNETGSEVTFVAGSIRVKTGNGRGMNVRGVKLKDGRMIVQVDHSKYTADQIADHEAFHAKVERYGTELVDRAVKTIKSKFPNPEMLDQVLDKYLDGLAGVYDVEGDTDAEKDRMIHDLILEELLADAYSGINSNSWGADKFTDIVNAYMDENFIGKQTATEAEAQRGPPAENTAERYSTEENKDTKKTKEKADAIVKQLKDNMSAIMELEEVASIDYNNATHFTSGNRLANQIDGNAVFQEQGGVAFRKGFGEVLLSNGSAAETIYHGNSPAKQAVFPAVKAVIENGIQIYSDKNHNGLDFDTFTFAAPIEFFNRKIAMAAVVKEFENGKGDRVFYVHEICDSDGNFLVLNDDYTVTIKQKKNAAPSDGYSVIRPDAAKEKNSPNEKIPQSSNKVKRESYSVDDATDAEYMRAVMDGDTETAQEMVREAAEAAGYDQLFYHGNKKGGGFNEFRDWQYFTQNKDYAQRYAQRGEDGKSKGLYTTYVKMEKLFDTRNADARAIFNDARMELGLGELQENGLPDWTDGYDLSDYIDENGLDYDSIVLDEGGDLVNGKPVSRGLSYVIRKSNQIKSADAITYDDNGKVIPLSERFNPKNNDIRYSVDTENQENIPQSAAEYRRLQEQQRAKLNAQAQDAQQGKLKAPFASKASMSRANLKTDAQTIFSIQEGARGEANKLLDAVADRFTRNGYIDESDRENLFNRLVELGSVTVPAEEAFSMGRDYIKGGTIYVDPSTVADFGDDWKDIRSRAFAAGLYLSTQKYNSKGNQNAGADMWNHALAQDVPGLFDEEETDSRNIIERILQVAEEGKDERVSLAEYTARLAQQEHMSEQEFYENMERQLDTALKSFARSSDIELRIKDRTERKLQKDAQDRADKAQRERERKQLAEMQKKTLKQLQWLKKNQNKAPEELRQTFEEVLSDIDLFAINAANEMHRKSPEAPTWRDLADLYKTARESDPNYLPSKEMEKIISRLDNRKIGEMDIGALQNLYQAATALRTEFYNRNNVIADENHRLFSELSKDTTQEIVDAKGKYTGRWWDKLFNMEQLTPMNYLERMTGWDKNAEFTQLGRQLEKGERDVHGYIVGASRMMSEFLKDNEDWVAKADGQGKDAVWYKYDLPELLELHMGDKPIFGKTVTVYMTPAQKVHLYLESKNLDNLRHMTGGRTFVNRELYEQGKRDEALAQGTTVRLAPETVKAIVSDLTPQEMELANLLEKYYNEYSPQEINRVSNILYGYDKAMGQNYAPIYTNQNYTQQEFGVFDVTAEGVGNLKERQVSFTPSYNLSAFDAFEKHMQHTSRFVGMAIPTRNWSTYLNWRTENNSTRNMIAQKWGQEAVQYIEDLITELQGGGTSDAGTTVNQTVEKVMSNYISGVFGMNPSIVLKQMGSIPLAASYLGLENLPSVEQIANIDQDLIAKYTPELDNRVLGYAIPETKQLKENPNWTEKNKFFSFVAGGGAITAMDGWAAKTLWPWAENKVQKTMPELEVGSDEYYKAVAQEFEYAVARSQSTSDMTHSSLLRKSKNPVTRALTLFRSDSAQTYNAIRQKIGEAQYLAEHGGSEEEVAAAKKSAGTTMLMAIAGFTWAEGIEFLMNLWKHKGKRYRDDEDELTAKSITGEMLKSMIGDMAGVVVGGEELAEIIGNVITGEKWYGITTPGMEQVNDALEAIMDSSKGMASIMKGAADVAKNDGDLGQYFAENSRGIAGNIKSIANTAAMYVSGLPAQNLESYLMGLVSWASPEMKAAYDDLWHDQTRGGLKGADPKALPSKVGRVLEADGLNVEKETRDEIARLFGAGFMTAVPMAPPDSVNVDGEKITLGEFDKQKYKNAFAGHIGTAMDELMQTEDFAAADEETRAKMLKRLYDHAANLTKEELFGLEADNTTKTNTALTESGVSLATAVAWDAAAVGMRNDEKSQKLMDMKLPEEQKRAIFTAKISDSKQVMEDLQKADEAGVSFDNFLKMQAQLTGSAQTRYMEAVGAGISEEDAFEFASDWEDLPKNAKTREKWKACVSWTDDINEQMTALSLVMTDNQMRNMETSVQLGMKPVTYIDFWEHIVPYDANHNGSYSTAEINAALQTYKAMDNDKAIIWQLATGSKKPRKNPFGKNMGAEALRIKTQLDEKAKANQQAEPTQEMYGQDNDFAAEIMRQLLGG